ncbi:MAG: hypothetical protein IJY36_04045 [Coprobacter sp.]|nr:hypothetical protein [Coprobacter sp.]
MRHITLPQWLDDYIYDELNIAYNPRPREVVLNPDQPYEFVRLYLGTYFPRSYAEAYCIVNSLLNNPQYYQRLSVKDELYLLDIFCGTGGEIIGAICALCSRLPNLQRIYIESYDANIEAIRFLYHVTEKLNLNIPNKAIYINPLQFYIDNEQNFRDLLSIINNTYDFILCFKAINEFVQQQIFNTPYSLISRGLLPKLSANGLFILTDVTTPVTINNITSYYPQIMNDQLNSLLRENDDYATLVPYACRAHENECNGCYMQDIFYVTHRYKQNDISKLVYRIIGRSKLVNNISINTQHLCRYNSPTADRHTPYCKF